MTSALLHSLLLFLEMSDVEKLKNARICVHEHFGCFRFLDERLRRVVWLVSSCCSWFRVVLSDSGGMSSTPALSAVASAVVIKKPVKVKVWIGCAAVVFTASLALSLSL